MYHGTDSRTASYQEVTTTTALIKIAKLHKP